MKTYCAIKDGKCFVGTKEEVVRQVCLFHIDERRRLQVKFSGFKQEEHFSYGEEFTSEEMYSDAIIHLFKRIKNYGYRVFVES